MATNNSNSISFNPQILGDSFRLSDKEDPKVKKLGFDLISLQEEYESSLKQDNDDEAFLQSSNLSLPVMENNLVVIDAVASGDIETLLADLQKLGMQNASSFGSIVSGLFPIESIEQLASLDSLKFAKPAIAITNVGATTSQADAAMNADIARSIFGVDGTGVTLGVLSDSYNDLGGAAADVASGDLPGVGNPLGYTKPVKVLQDLGQGGSDEGRAMLQLVHDVAPGAELAFRTAFLGQADFANGILELANVAGSDVIVDDVIYFAEPMFQDGIIAQAVDTVVGNGVSYFSSAGNNGRDAYESTFNPSDFVLDGFGEFHDFDPGSGVDIFQSITIPVNSGFSMSFQWDSPFFSVSGGAGSPNDLDIFVVDSTGASILAGSNDSNINGDPVELLSFFNDGSYGTDQFNIAISNFDGPNPNLMKYVMFGSNVTINEFDTASGTLFGHANANGAQAVGAASYQDTPRFGTDPAVLEEFSSPGPTPILFETDGTPTFELRQKPEIVAPDGTNTTFFGQDADGDGFPNFFGTSAAAPHAAAVAALMLEAASGTSPDEIYAALENTAIDMDDPSTPGFDVGFDDASGYGLIQADKALQQLVGNPVTPFTPFEPADDPLNLINAIVTDDKLTIHLEGDFSPRFTGGKDQTSFYDGSLTPLGIGAGILLTSGDGTPPLTNTSNSYSVSLGGVGDADLDAVATSAFSGAGATQDANLLEFSFNITDPNVKSVTFDLLFGSDEFPEYSNSSFVDVAGVFVNGQNYAYFNNDVTQPLSIIDKNLALGNFTDNASSTLPIEYDGVSDVLSIFAPVKQGKNTIKFAIADTGDQFFDSGLFISKLATSTLGNEDGSGILVKILGTEGDDEIIGSELDEFIDAGAGNDIIKPGLGNDFVDAGAGDDTIFGGQGDNQIDGGDGIDTVVYSGNKNEFKIEKIGDVIKVGSNTDTLNNVEFLQFDDGIINTSEIEEVTYNLVSGTSESDTLITGLDGFDGVGEVVFTGAGADEVDLIGGSNNRVNSGSDNDLIFVSSQDRVFGSSGNDEFDATDSTGRNRMSGGGGDDTFFLGKNDRALGGEGDDKFFVQIGGDNILSGGEGADQFWIVTTEIPEDANTVVDFEIGTDVIGILGSADLGIDKNTLVLNEMDGNTEIAFGGQTLAILNGVTGLDVNTSVVFN